MKDLIQHAISLIFPEGPLHIDLEAGQTFWSFLSVNKSLSWSLERFDFSFIKDPNNLEHTRRLFLKSHGDQPTAIKQIFTLLADPIGFAMVAVYKDLPSKQFNAMSQLIHSRIDHSGILTSFAAYREARPGAKFNVADAYSHAISGMVAASKPSAERGLDFIQTHVPLNGHANNTFLRPLYERYLNEFFFFLAGNHAIREAQASANTLLLQKQLLGGTVTI